MFVLTAILKGQYHYAFLISPRKYRHIVAFFTGWFSILGWWIITCSGLLLASLATLGLATFWHPTFVIEQWHVYLMYLATLLVTGKSTPFLATR
jgi:choline transport protein